jgi:hypothetical protein
MPIGRFATIEIDREKLDFLSTQSHHLSISRSQAASLGDIGTQAAALKLKRSLRVA